MKTTFYTVKLGDYRKLYWRKLRTKMILNLKCCERNKI